MSNTIKSSSAVLLESPKGYGVFKNNTKGQNFNFTNAITIYGKKHLLNCLFSHLTEGSLNNKIPKLSGLSILFRRCGVAGDIPTKDGHKLTKGFFEHIYLVYNKELSNVGKYAQQTYLSASVPAGLTTCDFSLNEINAKTDTVGCWGATSLAGTECLDPDPTAVWHDVVGSEGEAPKLQGVNQCLKEESSNGGFGYAKIAGISVLTTEVGSYSGGAQVASPHNNAGLQSPGNTIKVWRDPTFMELIHQQESLRQMGSATFQMPDHDAPHTAVSLGHYFPNKDHFTDVNSAVVARSDIDPFKLGDSDLIGSCSLTPATYTDQSACEAQAGAWTPSHNIWEWKHTAIDTFAFSGFVSHLYGANEGSAGDNVGSPFVSLDMSGRTAGNFYNGVGWVSDASTSMATGPFYKPIARQAGNFFAGTFGYDYDQTAYWAWADHDNETTSIEVMGQTESTPFGGDGLLPDTIDSFEIDYDKGGSQNASEQENFIDHNDTLSTKYTINFAQSSSYATALNDPINTQQNNDLGNMDTIIDPTLGEYLAIDFGQANSDQNVSGYINTPKCAIQFIRLLDKSGRCMAGKSSGGAQYPIGGGATTGESFDNTSDTWSAYTLGKVDVEEGKAVYVRNTVEITNTHINDKNTSFVLDNLHKRPRMLINTINFFFNQLEASSSTVAGSARPHTLELYGSDSGSSGVIGDLLFTFTLGSSDFADNIEGQKASPFFNAPNATDTVGGEILGNATADWTNGNHLDVTLKFVMV